MGQILLSKKASENTLSATKRRKLQAKKRQRTKKTIALAVVGLFCAALIMVLTVFVVVAAATYDLPNVQQAALLKQPETSKIFDVKGNLISNLYVDQNRINVPLEKISPYIQQAVIAIEDKRFYQHGGVDWQSISRALLTDAEAGKAVEGGSTLTQQYVKNTFVTPEKTFQRKIKEAALAYAVEKKYTKQQILAGYLNTVYFGQSSYGVETASQTFFGKSAAAVTLPEAALLAGVIRSPNFYSPYTNPDKAKERRDLVIKLMLQQKKINAAEAAAAQAAPLQIKPIADNQPTKYPYFIDYVKQLILDDKSFGQTNTQRANALYRGGLRIYTTIDPNLQSIAEQSAWNTLDQPNDPASALVSVEPKTGYIKAMVGGRDYQSQKFNLATQALRQPGSTFKPFVLATAIENGISIDKTYDSTPGWITKNWKVNNSDGGSGYGMMNLREATARSIDPIFARLILDPKIGPEKVVSTAHKLGITSFVDPYPAIALGGLTKGVTPLEMASAYGSFANGGLHSNPIAITKVTDAGGKVLKENKPAAEPAIDPVTAYLVSDILKGVINYGTGRAANIGRPAAGKTGTTENNGDAWFVGYTPDLVTSVWVGHPQNREPMTNVHGITVFGGTFPAEIWQKFMSRALENVPPTDFQRPQNGVSSIRVCADMPGFRANNYCPKDKINYIVYAKGTSSYLQDCNLHKPAPTVKVPNVVGMTIDQAQAALNGLGFNVTSIQQSSSGVPSGQVIAQSPGEGSDAPQGSTISLTVSSGPEPAKKVAVPNLVGLTESQALTTLTSLKLIGQIIYVPPGDPSMNGKVISQDPGGGAESSEGKTITLRVGKT